MATRGTNSSSTLLVVLALIITFPFWIAIGALLFGILAGVIGILFGVGGAIFGVLMSIIALPFKIIFGWGHHDWGWHSWPHIHGNGFSFLVFIIIVALVLRSRNK